MKKKFDFNTMYALCNKHQLFTAGDNQQYNKMFELCKQGITQEGLTALLYVCSAQTYEQVVEIVKNLFEEV